MCAPKNIHTFVAYAKNCACTLACKYVEKSNNGYDTTDMLNKLRLLNSYIKSIENYVYPTCHDFYYKGIKNLNGKKVFTSKKNLLYLTSEGKKIKVRSEDINCLTEEQICELANRIKSICANC